MERVEKILGDLNLQPKALSQDVFAHSSHKFWQRIMNECVRRRFLASKQIEQEVCLKHSSFEDFRECMK